MSKFARIVQQRISILKSRFKTQRDAFSVTSTLCRGEHHLDHLKTFFAFHRL
jgi:hypothetical protein